MIPDAFFEGIRQFNAGEFYDCHDILEALWFEAMEPEKSIYQGILQIAVGCYHLENRNLRGATILVGEGARRLRGSEPEYAGFDLADFVAQSDRLLSKLQLLDPSEVETCAQTMRHEDRFPRIRLIKQQDA